MVTALRLLCIMFFTKSLRNQETNKPSYIKHFYELRTEIEAQKYIKKRMLKLF